MLGNIISWLFEAMGWAMFAASLCAVFDGLPRQIMANYRTKTAPLNLNRFLLWAILSYSLRAGYTAHLGDYTTALAAVPGAIGSAILLLQQRVYRPTANPAEPALAAVGFTQPVQISPRTYVVLGGEEVPGVEIALGGYAESTIDIVGNPAPGTVRVENGRLILDGTHQWAVKTIDGRTIRGMDEVH